MTDLPSQPDDIRKQQLGYWVAQQGSSHDSSTKGSVVGSDIQLTPIANDAGFRRYFRFTTPSHWLAVDAPPQTEDSRQFIALARYLSEHGVSTPDILAADETQGFLLVEDFGDRQLYREITEDNADNFYRQAMDILIQLQTCPDREDLIPRYDQALLRRELDIFSEWFAQKLLGYQLNEQERANLNTLFSQLETNALAQTQCLVHRDYHSRNLMIKGKDLGVIDFQGALWGAMTYDLVSLLRDCYLRWPAARVNTWALEYHKLAMAAGLHIPADKTQFMRDFDWMGLQRHIKVLGIFARLHLRDNKPHYLHDLPLVIRYTLEVAGQYPELQGFADWFTHTLLPLAEQQAWYSDYRSAGERV